MPSPDPEFRRAIETIKLRLSIEDVVRDAGVELTARSGRLWGCCPFHEEKTPSFAVKPDEDFWYCFGACRTGGDSISFLERLRNLSFMDALELLAARTGVELPKRKKPDEKLDQALATLERADGLYQHFLKGSEGRAAREYLEGRGVSRNAVEAFGLGFAPAHGNPMVSLGRREKIDSKLMIDTGLVRVGESGEPYDFFRGRLMIPIRDVKGCTVGFGGRRLADGERAGPKYVNTPETRWFKKGQLIYGLDRAVDDVRRGGHLILVEGYTDVIAAHQAGLRHVGAVLGTATTPDHAGLVRRAGTRRVSLVFDGDEAGRRAAWRALEGLLPLDGLELSVVVLPAGQDPADLLPSGDAAPFLAQLDMARDWFDFACASLEGRTGRDLSQGVDEVLGLLGRIPKPVHAQSLLSRLAQRLQLPVETLRDQWNDLPQRRRAAQAATRTPEAGPDGSRSAPAGPIPAGKPVDPRLLRAYKGAIGAALVDPSLIPRVRGLRETCSNPSLLAILQALLELWDDEQADLTPDQLTLDRVMTQLGDHPVRNHVASLAEYVAAAEDPLTLLEGELQFIDRHELDSKGARLTAEIKDLERAMAAGDETAGARLERALDRLTKINRRRAAM